MYCYEAAQQQPYQSPKAPRGSPSAAASLDLRGLAQVNPAIAAFARREIAAREGSIGQKPLNGTASRACGPKGILMKMEDHTWTRVGRARANAANMEGVSEIGMHGHRGVGQGWEQPVVLTVCDTKARPG